MGIGRMCGCCAGMNPLRLAVLAASPFCFAKRGRSASQKGEDALLVPLDTRLREYDGMGARV